MTAPATFRPDWRDQAFYDALRRSDRFALAWEWLRRDPVYVQSWMDLGGDDQDPRSPEGWRSAMHWGLHFPRAA